MAAITWLCKYLLYGVSGAAVIFLSLFLVYAITRVASLAVVKTLRDTKTWRNW